MPENNQEQIQPELALQQVPEAPPEPNPNEGENSPATRRETKSYSDAWIGGLVWLVILGIAGYFWFFGSQADVLLTVSGPDNPMVAAGRVTLDGSPVAAGTVQVVVENPKDGRQLASAVTDVTNTGSFRLEFKDLVFTESLRREFRVVARYVGQTKDSKPSKGTSAVYVNMPPPLTLGWGMMLVPLLMLLLVFLFTGPLRPGKARVLFGITYIFTFLACVIPVLLTIGASQSRYLLDIMGEAPVGLLKAKAEALEQPQWLLNIGGAVTKRQPDASKSVAPPSATKGKGDALSALGSTPNKNGAPQTGPTPPPASPAQASVAELLAITTDTKAAVAANTEESELEVKGGLAIPLYVLVLAMLGAAINMTRKVPEIQADYDSNAQAHLAGVLAAPLAVLGMARGNGQESESKKDPSEIRRQLIETYLYFLSAPFLVVAVYYLLQVVAKSVAEPVLVVISFATGLMSNAAVGAIMAFADKTLKGVQE